MDQFAATMLRRTGQVTLHSEATPATDGQAWVATLEADLATRGWLLQRELREAAASLTPVRRLQWADWLLATIDELTGADRPLIPLYRNFPDTPPEAYAERLLTHLFGAEGVPCVLCGLDDVGAPLDPCGHLVCPSCFPPQLYSACPVCGRRLAAGDGYLVLPPVRAAATGAPLKLRLLSRASDLHTVAAAARDALVGRSGALSAADSEDLRVLIAGTAPGTLDWLPEPVPGRETLAVVIAWALHATALTPAYPVVLAGARQHWQTATDAARTLWAYSGGDPGLILPDRPEAAFGPGESWRPAHEPPAVVAPVRVRALPRPLRRAVLEHFEACGGPAVAEDLLRHPTVWKRLGERLHPFERPAAFPAAAVAFAALRGTRTSPASPLGVEIGAAARRHPHRLVLVEEPDGTVGVRVRTHAAAVEEALAAGDAATAARLLGERSGEFWRRLDHLLRTAGEDPRARAAVIAVADGSAGRVAPGVLAAAAAELTGREATVRATAEQVAQIAAARESAGRRRQRAAAAAAAHRAAGVAWATEAPAAASEPPWRSALRSAAEALGVRAAATTGPVEARPEPAEPAAAPGGPGIDVPRRLFFPSGNTVRTWTAPELRATLPVDAISTVRQIADRELTRRAARHPRFDVAVLEAALAAVPAPMRERAGSAQLAGWPRGSVRELPGADVLRLFLHWTDTEEHRVDLDLSCVFFGDQWARLGHCDYTKLRFEKDAAIHSGDLTSAPAPLGATEFLDLNLGRLRSAGVRYAVPVVLSYNSVPFELLGDAFAGLMLPEPASAQFDAARVAQRFDLRGSTKMLMPMVVDVADRRLLWTDLSLAGRGYGHSVSRHGDQLAIAAADQWSYFTSGSRATVLDLAAWHACARADRILLAYGDGRFREVPADPAAIRAAAGGIGDLSEAPQLDGQVVYAVVADADNLVPAKPAEGSVALTITGQPVAPWIPIRAGDALAALAPGSPD